jgi:arylsulfatase A-like enzyme
MAREGVRFVESYSNGPVCTPTRAALLTGRYQQRVGLEWAIVPAQKDAGLPTSELTLPRMLREDGYRTAIFGKWHLGQKPEFGPNAHGFEEFFGILGGNVDMYTHQNINGTLDLYENTELVRREGYLTDLITARAEKYIEKAESDKPFFLYVPYNSAHWPFQPPGRPDARTRETWMHGSRADYIKMVENIDDGVGRVLAALDRRKLAGNTLVVFTNDNGGERFSRNEPFFHHKATLWEGGIRVPTLMRWPGRIPAGGVSRQPMITMDITASVLAATGTRPPAGRNMEGIDLTPIVSGRKPEAERTFFWRIDRADRKQKAVRRKNFKYIRDGAIEMLMDIAKDPAERHDIAPQHPELLTELRQTLERWERDVDRDAPAMVVR